MILDMDADGNFPNDLLEEAFERCPESWDTGGAADSVLINYIRHLEEQVMSLRGCLLPACAHKDGWPCDHGYLSDGTPPDEISSCSDHP